MNIHRCRPEAEEPADHRQFVAEPGRRAIFDGEFGDCIRPFPALVCRALVDPGGDQHIRARALHEPEIIGVIDHAGQISVLELDTQDKMMLEADETAECWERVHARGPSRASPATKPLASM